MAENQPVPLSFGSGAESEPVWIKFEARIRLCFRQCRGVVGSSFDYGHAYRIAIEVNGRRAGVKALTPFSKRWLDPETFEDLRAKFDIGIRGRNRHMYDLKWLIHQAPLTQTEIDGQWVPARPVAWPGLTGFWSRLKAAWAVLTGAADAFKWPGGQ